MSKVFDLSIVTPGKEHVTYKAISLKTQTLDGGIQFLANHTPIILATIPCVTIIKTEEEVDKKIFTSTGLIHFENNKLMFICDAFEYRENIDVERALLSEERAKKRISSKDDEVDIERAKRALARSLVRVKFFNEG